MLVLRGTNNGIGAKSATNKKAAKPQKVSQSFAEDTQSFAEEEKESRTSITATNYAKQTVQFLYFPIPREKVHDVA